MGFYKKSTEYFYGSLTEKKACKIHEKRKKNRAGR